MKYTIFEHLGDERHANLRGIDDAQDAQLADEAVDWFYVFLGTAIFVSTVVMACAFVP